MPASNSINAKQMDIIARTPSGTRPASCTDTGPRPLANEQPAGIFKKGLIGVCCVLVVVGLYFLSLRAFLLFHTLTELFSVSVAFAIFLIVWNSRRVMQSNYTLFIGIAYLFVGAFDLLHTLAYEGMGVFPRQGADLPTQLWIATRYLESLSFLLAPLFIRRFRVNLVILSYALVSVLVLLTIFQWKVFPVCFIADSGLTAFKRTSEYVIIGILLASLAVLRRRASAFDPRVLRWISVSIVVTVASEFMFTLYADPRGTFNTVGHLLKLASFFLVYKALIEIGLREPYNLLYRDLKRHETDLERARDELEARVRLRTAELSQTVETLREEVQARMRAEERILADQDQLRTLTGQLLDAEDKERREIATQLHDSVGQILAFLKMELGELQRSNLPEDVLQSIRRSREQVNEAITRTRSLTFEISPPELYTLGLESALEELAHRFSLERGLECHVHDSEQDKPLSEQIKTLLYRSVRELLINAAKHARPKSIDITISRTGGRIQVVVQDDGVGFDLSRLAEGSPHKAAGFGLFSIRERLTHMGGTVYIESDNGRGTRVTLVAPLCQGDESLQ